MLTTPTVDRLPTKIGDAVRVELWCKWEDYVDPATNLTVVGGPVDLTGAKIRATCRREDTDSVAWTKHNTLDGGSDAQVEVIDATGAGNGKYSRLVVHATGADTAAMTPGRYLLDAVARLADLTTATLKVVSLDAVARPTTGDLST